MGPMSGIDCAVLLHATTEPKNESSDVFVKTYLRKGRK